MRQVLIIAILVAIAMAEKNCSAVQEPSMSTNYYMPPKSCVDTDAGIRGCMTHFSTCISDAKTTTGCAGINACFAGRILCLIGTTPQSSNCTAYAAGLDNAGLYLMAGGTYNGSTLENACEYGLCHAAMEAAENHDLKTQDGKVCPVDLSLVCQAPNFEPPTRSPTQAEYSITFGGEYAAILADAPKGSPKYKKLETAVARGLAALLKVLEHFIVITDMRSGSLIITFVVNDPSVEVATVTTQLQKVKDDPALATSTFTELATESGVAITVTGVATELPTPVPATLAPGETWAPTPEPATPTPAGPDGTPAPAASAGIVSVAVAVVAVLALMF